MVHAMEEKLAVAQTADELNLVYDTAMYTKRSSEVRDLFHDIHCERHGMQRPVRHW